SVFPAEAVIAHSPNKQHTSQLQKASLVSLVGPLRYESRHLPGSVRQAVVRASAITFQPLGLFAMPAIRLSISAAMKDSALSPRASPIHATDKCYGTYDHLVLYGDQPSKRLNNA